VYLEYMFQVFSKSLDFLFIVPGQFSICFADWGICITDLLSF
jgi:hypothetical protein